jgi:hypothetical protein
MSPFAIEIDENYCFSNYDYSLLKIITLTG